MSRYINWRRLAMLPPSDALDETWRRYGHAVVASPAAARRGVVRIMLITTVLGVLLGAAAASAIWMAVT